VCQSDAKVTTGSLQKRGCAIADNILKRVFAAGNSQKEAPDKEL
jgi:hypothetical protein